MGWDTKAFSAQDALVTALQGESGLSDWTIDFGIPAHRDSRHIWVDEQVDDWEQTTATSGLVTRNETFRLSIYLYARQTGADALELRNEITGAAAIVSETIGSAPFLGGVVLFAEIVGGEYDGAFADPDGRSREGVLKLTVACNAFLTGA